LNRFVLGFGVEKMPYLQRFQVDSGKGTLGLSLFQPSLCNALQKGALLLG
jgi:hypothetical protein